MIQISEIPPRKSDNLKPKGTHVVCAIVTAEFLAFTKSLGNDLSTPHPEFQGNMLDRTLVSVLF